MNIVCACPACHTGMYQASIENASSLTCPACGQSIAIPQGAIQVAEQNAHPRLVRCLVCPSTELFVRKNFPQRLGIAIVIAGLVASCVAWGYRDLFWTFGILFSTALLDVILFFVVPDCLTCYRCGARYTGTDGMGEFGNFNLETHEKYRQQAARSRQSTLPS
jgi:uncharacterized protein YbaR (Trm112 family)